MPGPRVLTLDVAPLGLEVQREYVVGYPVHVAITVLLRRGAADRIELRNAPPFDVLGSPGLGAKLSDPRDGRVIADVPARRYDPEWAGGVTLVSDEPRRMLVDVSGLLPADLGPGRYTLVTSYPLPVGVAVSDPVEVAFRAPTVTERDRLRAIGAALQAAGSWGRWTTMPVDRSGLPLEVPVHAGDPLRLDLLLRRWRRGIDQVRVLEPALGTLDGVYEPEREALRAERLVAIGDATAGVELAAKVRRSWPGLAWWTDTITNGLLSWTGLRLR